MYNMDLNKELFRKLAPHNKLELLRQAKQSDFLNITFDTLERMVKEAGKRISENHVAKELYIDREFAHNDRNSRVESIYQGRKRGSLYMNIYLQGYDTDTNIQCEVTKFLSREEILGSFTEEYLHGGPCIIQAKYDAEDKARVIHAICLAYIHNKYAAKLS